jgi:hypothetical protein
MAIKKHDFTFESSGVVVRFRKVNPLVSIDVRTAAQKSKPQAPVEQLEVAGVLTEVKNEDDPDYVELMDIWEDDLQHKINEAYVKQSKLEFLTKDGERLIEYAGWREEVDAYRKMVGVKIEDSDEWVFLTRIISVEEELRDFYQAISSATLPSPEAIQAAKDSFRS